MAKWPEDTNTSKQGKNRRRNQVSPSIDGQHGQMFFAAQREPCHGHMMHWCICSFVHLWFLKRTNELWCRKSLPPPIPSLTVDSIFKRRFPCNYHCTGGCNAQTPFVSQCFLSAFFTHGKWKNLTTMTEIVNANTFGWLRFFFFGYFGYFNATLWFSAAFPWIITELPGDSLCTASPKAGVLDSIIISIVISIIIFFYQGETGERQGPIECNRGRRRGRGSRFRNILNNFFPSKIDAAGEFLLPVSHTKFWTNWPVSPPLQ